MKLILLQHLSGAKGTFAVGDTVTVDEATALRYIKKGIAKPKTKEELESFMQKAQAIENEEASKAAKANAIMKESAIKIELNALYAQVVLKEAELRGDVLSDQDIVSEIDALIVERT